MAITEKSRRAFHPAVSILSWLIFVLAVELADTEQLILIAPVAGLLLVRQRTFAQFVSLVWKARWLWLALLLMYAWTIPGMLVLPYEYSPTQEGLSAGLLRIGRLILLLAALARLLEEFNPQQLAGGIYILTKPLVMLGLEPRALAVRLVLTLEQVKRQPRGGKWIEQLGVKVDQSAGTDEIIVYMPSVGLKDSLVLFVALVMLGAVLI